MLGLYEKGSKMTKNDHFDTCQIHDFDIKTMVFMSKTTKIDDFDGLGGPDQGPRGPRMVPEGSLRVPLGDRAYISPLGGVQTPF